MPEQQICYAEVTISIQGTVSGIHLYDPPRHSGRGSTQSYDPLESLLPSLAEGGYVIDLQPLADHPNIVAWSFASPLPSLTDTFLTSKTHDK